MSHRCFTHSSGVHARRPTSRSPRGSKAGTQQHTSGILGSAWIHREGVMDLARVPEITPARFDVTDVAGFKAHLTEHGYAVVKYVPLPLTGLVQLSARPALERPSQAPARTMTTARRLQGGAYTRGACMCPRAALAPLRGHRAGPRAHAAEQARGLEAQRPEDVDARHRREGPRAAVRKRRDDVHSALRGHVVRAHAAWHRRRLCRPLMS